MVQYRDARHRGGSEDYWKVLAYDTLGWSREDMRILLGQKGVKYHSSSNQSRLVKILNRYNLGAYCYDKCTSRELLTFIKQRRITLPEDKPSKSALAHTLEHADDNATFDKFGDLPAELRLRIYGFYYAWLEGDGIRDPTFPVTRIFSTCTQPPPLTRVSRLLRQESLPLFFQRLRFKAFIKWPAGLRHDFIRELHKVSEECIDGIRSLGIVVHDIRNHRHDRTNRLELRLYQRAGERPATYQIDHYRGDSKWPSRDGLEKKLDILMKHISDRSGSKMVLRSDAQAVFDIFPRRWLVSQWAAGPSWLNQKGEFDGEKWIV